MASKIKVLDEQTINKIAAGEVIENPASVVKELVENAIDAGSTHITVEIVGGGRQLIRVSDNGSGMGSDDAILCLERHATSKIKEVEDIHSLNTMGFRGEAIPSIASISKFSLLTYSSPKGESKNDCAGTMVIVEGGKILSCSPAVRSHGTTIEVKELFFNIPVRKKFQKSPTHDANEILRIMTLMALGQPQICFELISNQKVLFSCSKVQSNAETSFNENLFSRIKETLGEEYASRLIPVFQEKGEYSLQGFVGYPTEHRLNRTSQYLFINGRAIQSPLISFAVRDGYNACLPSQRYPVFVIHLSIPGSHVDVNVHPQKKEVRFRQEATIKDLIIQGVRQALGQTHAPRIPLDGQSTPSYTNRENTSLPWDHYEVEKVISDLPPDENGCAENPIKSDNFALCLQPSSSILSQSENLFLMKPWKEEQREFLATSRLREQSPRIFTTIKRYLIIDPSTLIFANHPSEPKQNFQGICVVDQVAAEKRILFEQCLSRLRNHEGQQKEIQPLLIPLTIDLSYYHSSLMRQYLPLINRMGFSIQDFGSQTFIIDAIPEFFDYHDLSKSLPEMLENLKESYSTTGGEPERIKQAATIASRMSRSNNKKLSIEEGIALLEHLSKCENPFRCPQGNLIIVYMDQETLEPLFKSRHS